MDKKKSAGWKIWISRNGITGSADSSNLIRQAFLMFFFLFGWRKHVRVEKNKRRWREKISGGMLANSSVDDEIFCQFLKRKRKRRQGKRSRGFDVDKPWTVLFLSISFTFHMVTYDYVCTRMKETKKNQICLGNLCRNENKSSSSSGASGDLFPLLVNS